MKRYISLVLAAVVLVFSLAVPAFASETSSFDNYDYINVLDYTDIGLGLFSVKGSDPALIDISLPSHMYVRHVDFIILDRAGGINSIDLICYGNPVSLSVVNLGNDYYRVFGKVNWTLSSLTFRIDHGNGSYGQIYFCSLYVSLTNSTHFEAPLVCQGFTPVSDVDLSLHTGDNRPTKVLWSIDDFADRSFSFSCYSPEWYKYDYLDIQVIASVSDITSVSAVFDEIAIPFTVSEIYSSNTDDNPYCISVRLDLRGLDRDSDDVPEVTIMGQSSFDGSNGFSLAGCSGYILQNDKSPLFYFFKQLTSNLSGFFDNLRSSIGGTITEWGQKIVQAINPDSSAVDEFHQQVDDSNKELNDMAAVMDSFTSPDINSINVDVGSFVSATDINSLTVPLGLLFESNIVTSCIMISIILATVMFVLYGKR